MNHLKEESVADFYAEKSVFVTGGTGFLGKILIEKLLYSCEAIDHIYVLIRKKREQTPFERIDQLLKSEIFARLRRDNASALRKVVPVAGDMRRLNLGLSAADEELIISKVSVIFHLAATVNFNDPLRNLLTDNVEATKGVINLCHRLKTIDALVYVSTAYTNTNQKVVEERVYPPPATLGEVYDFVNTYGDDTDGIKKLLNGKPNTYTFTKSLAESLTLREHGDIPTAIVRPSIVLSVLKEPIPGWLENWYGPTGLLYACSQGLHRSMVGSGSNVADFIPVDIVTNAIIVVATRCKKSKCLNVYNLCSGAKNPITYDTTVKTFITSCVLRGWSNVPFPRLIFVKWSFLNHIIKFFLVKLPFYIIDIYLTCFGRPKYMKMIRKTKKVEDLMTFFTSHSWLFKDGNVRHLVNTMTPKDRETFYCDPEQIQWKTYMDEYCVGVFKYLVKK